MEHRRWAWGRGSHETTGQLHESASEVLVVIPAGRSVWAFVQRLTRLSGYSPSYLEKECFGVHLGDRKQKLHGIVAPSGSM